MVEKRKDTGGKKKRRRCPQERLTFFEGFSPLRASSVWLDDCCLISMSCGVIFILIKARAFYGNADAAPDADSSRQITFCVHSKLFIPFFGSARVGQFRSEIDGERAFVLPLFIILLASLKDDLPPSWNRPSFPSHLIRYQQISPKYTFSLVIPCIFSQNKINFSN